MDKIFKSIKLKRRPLLDPQFIPASMFNKFYRESYLEDSGSNKLVKIALMRDNGNIKSFEFEVDCKSDLLSFFYIERIVKFMIWAYGGHTLFISGPPNISNKIQESYSFNGIRKFDLSLMEKVYSQEFEVIITDDVPTDVNNEVQMGTTLNGARIGIDLGASDYKLAAVLDGEVLFSKEVPWNPTAQSDSNYHISKIREGLKIAASYLPEGKADAIGVSSAGIVVDNRFKVASLFRSVNDVEFKNKIQDIFIKIKDEYNVSLVLCNDGDVSALAGLMSINDRKNGINGGVLGMALGSSEAVGLISKNGNVTGQLNELAFAPVDYSPLAVGDEWSKDIGVGALYFSQQTVNRLGTNAGIHFCESMLLPERLVAVQTKISSYQTEDELSNSPEFKIFKTIGTYLGYTIPHYKEFYDFTDVNLLGRVMSGIGGELILEEANKVLEEEFSEVAPKIKLNIPDERARRVGQAVAAASLPSI